MAFLVAIDGILTATSTTNISTTPVAVAHWPHAGAHFKGSFEYHPMSPAHPGLFRNIYVDLGSFSLLREPGPSFNGTINMLSSNRGIQYVDPWSTGFTNVHLPAANWQLNEFQLNFNNDPGPAPAVNPSAIDFNLFAERTIWVSGANDGPGPSTIVFHLLCRIDCVTVLPLRRTKG